MTRCQLRLLCSDVIPTLSVSSELKLNILLTECSVQVGFRQLLNSVAPTWSWFSTNGRVLLAFLLLEISAHFLDHLVAKFHVPNTKAVYNRETSDDR